MITCYINERFCNYSWEPVYRGHLLCKKYETEGKDMIYLYKYNLPLDVIKPTRIDYNNIPVDECLKYAIIKKEVDPILFAEMLAIIQEISEDSSGLVEMRKNTGFDIGDGLMDIYFMKKSRRVRDNSGSGLSIHHNKKTPQLLKLWDSILKSSKDNVVTTNEEEVEENNEVIDVLDCDVCYSSNAIYTCSLCSSVAYCSIGCQSVDWNMYGHNLTCKSSNSVNIT